VGMPQRRAVPAQRLAHGGGRRVRTRRGQGGTPGADPQQRDVSGTGTGRGPASGARPERVLGEAHGDSTNRSRTSASSGFSQRSSSATRSTPNAASTAGAVRNTTAPASTTADTTARVTRG